VLPKVVQDVVFHVYEQMAVRKNDIHYYLHVKDTTKSQTLYSLYSLKPSREPIGECTFSRTTEYHTDCNRVYVGSAAQSYGVMLGRLLTITTGTGLGVDMPDRRSPHQFTYGNRRFVWKKPKDTERLYEVRSESPVLGRETANGGPNVRGVHRLNPVQV
jgi:hypothetical protein